MFLEICAPSYTSALAAQAGGAHRIELCAALELGGLTPSAATIQKTVSALSIPVHVLIRPRMGDFCYSDEEMEIILEDILFCKTVGCAGVVAGALLPNGQVDVLKTKQMVNAASGMRFTFHRAFDLTPDPFKALERVVEAGATDLLTSGQQPVVTDAVLLLKQLAIQAQGRIDILAGGGVRKENVGVLLNIGIQGVHASATDKLDSLMTHRPALSLNAFGADDYVVLETSAEKVIRYQLSVTSNQ